MKLKLSSLIQQKVNPDFIDLINKLFFKNQTLLIWDKDTHYNLYRTDLNTPIASFDMFAYTVLEQDNLTQAIAFTNFTPDPVYQNRTIIRTIFELIAHASDKLNQIIILNANDFIKSTPKFQEQNILALDFKPQNLLELTGIKSNFEYIRYPKEQTK